MGLPWVILGALVLLMSPWPAPSLHPCSPFSLGWAPLGFFYSVLSWSKTYWGTFMGARHRLQDYSIHVLGAYLHFLLAGLPGSLSQRPVPPLPGPCA